MVNSKVLGFLAAKDEYGDTCLSFALKNQDLTWFHKHLEIMGSFFNAKQVNRPSSFAPSLSNNEDARMGYFFRCQLIITVVGNIYRLTTGQMVCACYVVDHLVT